MTAISSLPGYQIMSLAPTNPEFVLQNDGDSSVRQMTLFLRRRIAEDCIARGESRKIISPTGKKQNWLIDLRRLFTRPEALEMLAELFFARFAFREPVQLAGMESASIPLLTALAIVGRRKGVDISVAIIRKERKKAGLGNNIEGNLNHKDVILIDDLLNSGGSAEKARVVLENTGARVKFAFVVVDYTSRDGLAWRKRHGIAIESLFTLADFDLQLKQPRNSNLTRSYEPAWQFRAPGGTAYHNVPKSTPLLVNDRLYFGSDAGAFWSLDAGSGRPVWKFETRVTHDKGIWSSPAYHDGRIFFGTYNGDVYALDAETGRIIWCHPGCEWVGSSPLLLPQCGSLVVGFEYAKSNMSGSMCALSLESGNKLWEHWLRVVQHGSGCYFRRGDLVICGTNDHNVMALKPDTGELAWEFKTRRSVKYAPAVDEERGLVAFASFDTSIYILDAASGEKVAEFKTENICYTTPLFAYGKLFCGSGDRHLYVIDLDTMSLATKINAGGRVYSSPRLIGDSVIFGSNGGVVREIDPISLEVIGKLTVPDAVPNAVAFSTGGTRIFVATSLNEIHAFDRVWRA